MRTQQHASPTNVVPFALFPAARDASDEETDRGAVRDLWPSVVDLAKRPGTIGRLHALLEL